MYAFNFNYSGFFCSLHGQFSFIFLNLYISPETTSLWTCVTDNVTFPQNYAMFQLKSILFLSLSASLSVSVSVSLSLTKSMILSLSH